jgi:hypothetical protein
VENFGSVIAAMVAQRFFVVSSVARQPHASFFDFSEADNTALNVLGVGNEIVRVCSPCTIKSKKLKRI